MGRARAPLQQRVLQPSALRSAVISAAAALPPGRRAALQLVPAPPWQAAGQRAEARQHCALESAGSCFAMARLSWWDGRLGRPPGAQICGA